MKKKHTTAENLLVVFIVMVIIALGIGTLVTAVLLPFFILQSLF